MTKPFQSLRADSLAVGSAVLLAGRSVALVILPARNGAGRGTAKRPPAALLLLAAVGSPKPLAMFGGVWPCKAGKRDYDPVYLPFICH